VVGDDVEGEDQAARVVGAADRVAHVDVEHRLVVPGGHLDLLDLDTWLPAVQGDEDLVLDPARGGLVDGCEDHVVDGAAEFGPHRPLPRRGGQDQPHRLLDLALAADQRDAAGGADPHRERPTAADELFGHQITCPQLLCAIRPPAIRWR
jgi:hypothetical protein